MERLAQLADGLVYRRAFEYTIIGVILFNAVLLGLAALPDAQPYQGWSSLGIFVVEALLKLLSSALGQFLAQLPGPV